MYFPNWVNKWCGIFLRDCTLDNKVSFKLRHCSAVFMGHPVGRILPKLIQIAFMACVFTCSCSEIEGHSSALYEQFPENHPPPRAWPTQPLARGCLRAGGWAKLFFFLPMFRWNDSFVCVSLYHRISVLRLFFLVVMRRREVNSLRPGWLILIKTFFIYSV